MYIRESSSNINRCRVFTFLWLTVNTILNRDKICFTVRTDNLLQYSSIRRVLVHKNISYREINNKLLINNPGIYLAPYEIGKIFNKKDIANGLIMWLNYVSGHLGNSEVVSIENDLVRSYILEIIGLVTKYLYIDRDVDLKNIPLHRFWEHISYLEWYNRLFKKDTVDKRCDYVNLHYLHVMLIIEICLTSYSSNKRLFKFRAYTDTAFYLKDVLNYISYLYKDALEFEYKLVQVNENEIELRLLSASGMLPSYYLQVYNTKELIQVLNKLLENYATVVPSLFTSSYVYKCSNQLVLTFIEELFSAHGKYFSVVVDHNTFTAKISKKGPMRRLLHSFVNLFKPDPINSEVLKHIKSRGKF